MANSCFLNSQQYKLSDFFFCFFGTSTISNVNEQNNDLFYIFECSGKYLKLLNGLCLSKLFCEGNRY